MNVILNLTKIPSKINSLEPEKASPEPPTLAFLPRCLFLLLLDERT